MYTFPLIFSHPTPIYFGLPSLWSSTLFSFLILVILFLNFALLLSFSYSQPYRYHFYWYFQFYTKPLRLLLLLPVFLPYPPPYSSFWFLKITGCSYNLLRLKRRQDERWSAIPLFPFPFRLQISFSSRRFVSRQTAPSRTLSIRSSPRVYVWETRRMEWCNRKVERTITIMNCD